VILYRLWRLAQLLIGAVPLRLAYTGAGAIARIAWLAMPVQRRNATANMLHVVGPSRRRRARILARRSFINYARYVVDLIRQPSLRPEQLLRRVDFSDWSRLDAAVAEGRGCIFVLMHFGNWDAGAAVLALHGYRINVIAETQANARINADLVATRTALGVKLIPMERAASGVVRAIQRNEVLAILFDRPLSEGGVEVQFFDAPVRLPAGPARIALRTGARVIAASLARIALNDDRLRVLLDFDLEPLRTGDLDRDVVALTQRIVASHERVIRRYPDQWYMFRSMWNPNGRDQLPATPSRFKR